MKVKTLPKNCTAAKDIIITQALLNEYAAPFAGVGYTQKLVSTTIVDGKHVALVEVSNNAMRDADEAPTPFLQCACDFYYTPHKGGGMCKMLTFSCARKDTVRSGRRKEVGAEYKTKGMTVDEIFLDLFARVCCGEWVGQAQGHILYLQEAAMIAGMEGEHFTLGWDVGARLVEQKKISLDGAVMLPYFEPLSDLPHSERKPIIGSGEDDGVMLVWSMVFDGRFHCEVQRLHSDGYKAVLCIFDIHAQPDTLLGFAEVGLSYGAKFGPDSGDTCFWKAIIEQFVNGHVYHKTIVPVPGAPTFTLVTSI